MRKRKTEAAAVDKVFPHGPFHSGAAGAFPAQGLLIASIAEDAGALPAQGLMGLQLSLPGFIDKAANKLE